MKRMNDMHNRETEKKKQRQLVAEYARLNKQLKLESPKFRKMLDIRKELKL